MVVSVLQAWGVTMAKQGKQPRTRREVISYAVKRGGRIVEGGRHTKIYGPYGHTEVHRHRGDIPRGTLSGIMRKLRLIGLATLVLGIPICLGAWLAVGLMR